MTLPSANDDRSPAPDPTGDPARPEWLTGMDDDMGQVPARPRPVARAPVKSPPRETPDGYSKAEGLVRFEAPAAVQPLDIQRGIELGAQAPPSSASPPVTPGRSRAGSSAPPPAAWSAAASSIPSVRVSRRAPVPTDSPVSEETWEEPEFTPIRASSSAASSPVPPRAPAGRDARSPFSPVVKWISSVVATPQGMLAIAVVVVAVVVAAVILRPRERFTSIQHIRAHAQDLDGRSVNIQGTVGQTFPMGGGFAYYLHQARDTIVVFTRNRTPVERTRVQLAGTVSTGFLDGVARPAIFEDALLSK